MHEGTCKKKKATKLLLLPPFSCLIVHARTAMYAFVNPESPRLNQTFVQLNCDLKETLPVSAPYRYSFLFTFALSSCTDTNEPDVLHCKARRPRTLG